MPKRGKKYLEAKKKADSEVKYDFNEGVKVAIEGSYTKFDESVDLAVRLGVDPRHADQMVRGTVILPNGSGKGGPCPGVRKGRKRSRSSGCWRGLSSETTI